jgi:SAM-dependent methyltransferase
VEVNTVAPSGSIFRVDFDSLVTEAAAVSVTGWDFSWLAGRASEERPPWGYARLMGERLGRSSVALDVQTGGGEVLAGAPRLPALTVATESWPPNRARAAALLGSRAAVVAAADSAPLPFRDGTFDLVTCRHPVSTWWADVARVLAPGGAYLSQQVGPRSGAELVDFFLGPQDWDGRRPSEARVAAEQAGLRVVDLRTARLRMEFHDVGAVIYFLRKVIWMVPDFTVEAYQSRLVELHELITTKGPFIAHSSRFLIEARKPE